MRLFLILALAGSTSFANQISKYDGEIHSLSDVALCEQEIEKTIEAVEGHEGFRVIEGGCIRYGQERVRAQFTYSHPMIRQIERYERSFKDKKSCTYHASTSKFSFENAKLHTVATFCDDKKLVVDFIDYDFQLVSRLHFPMEYSEEQECRDSLNRLNNKLRPHGVNTLIATCEKSAIFPMKVVYTPRIDVARYFNTSINSILGRKLNKGEACTIDEADLAKRFKSVDIELTEAGCADYGKSSFEYFVFVKKSKVPYLQKFNGGSYTTESTCSEQLEKAVRTLEEMGNTTLYSYCTNSPEAHVPVIYYTR